jgi:hypothetical protein
MNFLRNVTRRTLVCFLVIGLGCLALPAVHAASFLGSGPPTQREPSAFLHTEGSATVIPDHVPVLSWTSLHLVYQVGTEGMVAGGGIQVQFPKSWHPWLPTPAAPQTEDPTAPYYATAQTSRPGVGVEIGVANVAIDGRTDRLDWTATLTTTGGALIAGDLITYTLGDQSGGGAGAQACATAMQEAVHVAADPEADGTFVELAEPLSLTLTALAPYRLAVFGPSQTHPGQPFRLLVAAQDTFTNLATTYTATVSFAATDPLAELPAPYTFTPTDDGKATFTVTLHTTGTQWITVTDGLVAPGGQPSNPLDCNADPSLPSLYWGDLHSHTEFSKDGVGPLTHALARVRDELGLDFYAATDHVDYPTTGLLPAEWQATRDLLAAYGQPGRFVPILAYEWSMPAPYGHHNVYFEGDDGPLCYLDECNTLQALWSHLAGVAALTIPHHTGIRWGTIEHTVDWSYNQPEFRTSVEIYSVHGESEMYDPADPLSYENRHPGAAESVDGPHYARDAWAAGLKLGVVAGSDNHDVRPGMPWNGLTAIYAPDLSRPALFDALRARHTYATTGERILLDFRLGQAMMGDVVWLPLPGAPTLDVRVVGTTALDWVELVRFDGLAYTVVYSATGDAAADPRQVAFRYTDTTLAGDGLYYVRVQQPDPNKPDRPARAWSSPIWVERGAVVYLPLVQRAGGEP